jgi:hypothetical membrane protein
LSSSDRAAIKFCLGTAIAVPILYFGTQLVASAFYPRYSFLQLSASMLGSPNSTHPAVFNTGAILTGAALMIAGYGIFRSLLGKRVHPALCWLALISMVASGYTSIQAGIFPLPDPRHTAFGFLVIFLIALPLILLLALWKQPDARGTRIFLMACCLAILLLAPVMSHPTLVPGASGLMQRIFASVIFLPVAAVGWELRSSR